MQCDACLMGIVKHKDSPKKDHYRTHKPFHCQNKVLSLDFVHMSPPISQILLVCIESVDRQEERFIGKSSGVNFPSHPDSRQCSFQWSVDILFIFDPSLGSGLGNPSCRQGRIAQMLNPIPVNEDRMYSTDGQF